MNSSLVLPCRRFSPGTPVSSPSLSLYSAKSPKGWSTFLLNKPTSQPTVKGCSRGNYSNPFIKRSYTCWLFPTSVTYVNSISRKARTAVLFIVVLMVWEECDRSVYSGCVRGRVESLYKQLQNVFLNIYSTLKSATTPLPFPKVHATLEGSVVVVVVVVV